MRNIKTVRDMIDEYGLVHAKAVRVDTNDLIDHKEELKEAGWEYVYIGDNVYGMIYTPYLTPNMEYFNIKVPTDMIMGKFIGTGGSNIKRMEREFQMIYKEYHPLHANKVKIGLAPWFDLQPGETMYALKIHAGYPIELDACYVSSGKHVTVVYSKNKDDLQTLFEEVPTHSEVYVYATKVPSNPPHEDEEAPKVAKDKLCELTEMLDRNMEKLKIADDLSLYKWYRDELDSIIQEMERG